MAEAIEISKLIKGKAKELGFVECTILPAKILEKDVAPFQKWLDNNYHGAMGYMANNVDKRVNPKLLVENLKSIIVLFLNYFPAEKQTDPTAPILSKYAYGVDYHFVMKDKLKDLMQFINDEITPCSGRAFVDSAPVLERSIAREAGLGWIGKNSTIISKKHGSFIFIGELMLDIALPYDEPTKVTDHCGSCTRCIDACPTKAIVAEKVIDARKCISYQTIELRGELDENLRGKFQNRVFGCDICQDVCPWNRKLSPHNEPLFQLSDELKNLTRAEWYAMDKPLFNRLFRNSPVKRTGYKGLQRNLAFIQDDLEKNQ